MEDGSGAGGVSGIVSLGADQETGVGVRCAMCVFFFSSRRRHTRYIGDWSSDVCSSDLSFAANVSDANGSTKNVSDASASTANVSVRRDERVPAHPSASSFRVGGFLRSWQASVGTALLVLALGVAVFALWRDGKTAGRSAQPAPTPQATAPQTVAQPAAPAQVVAAPQPSVALPTPDAQGVAVPAEAPGATYAVPAEAPGATYAVPAPAGQPFYVP